MDEQQNSKMDTICARCGGVPHTADVCPSRPLPSGLDPENPSVDTFNPPIVTLRDYFAASALTGTVQTFTGAGWATTAAETAYMAADAMLEARKRVQDKQE